ncbi:MAG: PASTA domain-containing protein [Vicingaceae bacterium]
MASFFRFIVSKVFFLNLFIALLLIAGGLYATLSYLEDFTLHGKRIEVPNLVGKNVEDLDSLLANGEFTQQVADSVFQKDVAGGRVLEQDPKAGYQVKQGRKIYLTVASYEPVKIEMPNLEGLSLRQATSLMETFGLSVGKLTYQPDVCTNCILEMQIEGKDLEEGSRLAKGSAIDLVVGRGLSNELTSVPYLIELKVEMAADLLKSKYLNVGSMIYDQSVENGEDSAAALVYRYTPFYSEEPSVPMGSSVDLFLTVDTNRIDHTVNPQDSI